MKYVIIGNSTAAVGCVEGIREVDKKGEITIISDEPHHTYSRPLISYLIYGKTDEQRMKYRPDSFYDDNGVTAMLGKKVTAIDNKKMTVSLESGETVNYDKLLVATGSKPFVPPMNGLENVEKKFTFMTLDSAKALWSELNENSRVLIIGAGLTGLKCVEGIADKCAKVTVVDMADKVMPSALDSEGSALVQKSIEKHGVEFILGDCVEQFAKSSASLKSGKTVDFDIVVLAVGVRPNTELVSPIGVNINRAILTDNHQKTNDNNIYSAGDCTESYDITSKQNRVLALLPNAYMQGVVAGVNMAGGDKTYDNAIPMNAIGFFGYHILSAGSYDGECFVEQDGENYKKLVVRDNKLVGFIMIGDIKRAGIYTSLIRNETDLSTVDFELLKVSPQLLPFSKSEREVMLGGAK